MKCVHSIPFIRNNFDFIFPSSTIYIYMFLLSSINMIYKAKLGNVKTFGEQITILKQPLPSIIFS